MPSTYTFTTTFATANNNKKKKQQWKTSTSNNSDSYSFSYIFTPQSICLHHPRHRTRPHHCSTSSSSSSIPSLRSSHLTLPGQKQKKPNPIMSNSSNGSIRPSTSSTLMMMNATDPPNSSSLRRPNNNNPPSKEEHSVWTTAAILRSAYAPPPPSNDRHHRTAATGDMMPIHGAQHGRHSSTSSMGNVIKNGSEYKASTAPTRPATNTLGTGTNLKAYGYGSVMWAEMQEKQKKKEAEGLDKLGLMQLKNGRWREAFDLFDKAVDLASNIADRRDRNSNNTSNVLAYRIHRTEALIKLGEVEVAVRELETVLRMDPRSYTAQHILAALFLRYIPKDATHLDN